MAFIHILQCRLNPNRENNRLIKDQKISKKCYICKSAKTDIAKPPQKPTKTCRPLLRPIQSRAVASKPASTTDASIAQKSDNTPKIFRTIKIATAAPIAVICRLTLHNGKTNRQKTSHIIAAMAILRKKSSDGAFIRVMAHNM